MTIKRSILLIQKEEFLKAEQMLHIALRQAQTLQHYDGITYVYDVMANLAYNTDDFKKAEKLFLSVLKRLVAKGIPENNLAIIHISLKIADICDKKGDIEKAETGYKFCLEHLQSYLTKDSENKDVLQLLGLNLEKYASMLFSQSRYTAAHKYFIQAYDICIKINGEENEQTVILLNDLGSVNYMLQNYDKAVEYLTKAAEIGKKFPDMIDLGFIHVNLGNTLIEKGLYEEAKINCSKGERLAKNENNEKSMTEAKKCLEKIRGLIS
ncbi:Tetratricopeptide repeat protein 19 homolog, mitochondrial [Anthophora plagiata]